MEHNHLTMKSYMAIVTERDAAIRERNLALDDKKRLLAERDLAMLQRDAAIEEYNSAIIERDEAIAAFEYRYSSMNGNDMTPHPPGNGIVRGAKHMHHQQHMHHLPHVAEIAYNPRDIPINDPFLISAVASETAKPGRVKRMKETKEMSAMKSLKPSKKGKSGAEDFSKQVTIATINGWENGRYLGGSGEDLNKRIGESEPEWKDDLGLNQVNFDESTMPVPVCSCTGVLQPCYKWANGGWQSACCTTTLSMYPLPQMPNNRHSRVGGRKMSGSVFNKLLSRLAAEGHDLSTPLDLKDHWAKHGTNRYITIK